MNSWLNDKSIPHKIYCGQAEQVTEERMPQLMSNEIQGIKSFKELTRITYFFFLCVY